MSILSYSHWKETVIFKNVNFICFKNNAPTKAHLLKFLRYPNKELIYNLKVFF